MSSEHFAFTNEQTDFDIKTKYATFINKRSLLACVPLKDTSIFIFLLINAASLVE